jgi:histo-blood group ABO system transferase
MRYEMYYKAKDLYKDLDYIFATDADMLFVDTVGDEILSERVATQHPGFVGRLGTYETNQNSTAYVDITKAKYYFAGGFNGGSKNEFFRLAETITKNIYVDLSKNLIAVWHDESHLNKYYIDNQPTLILSPSYCYPESWKLPYQKRLLALDKNHAQMRK